MKKIIVVDSGCGRVGSSALMGLLHIAKVNIGKDKAVLQRGDRLNPKGYFEPASIKKFVETRYRGYFPGIEFPTMAFLDAKGVAGWQGFSDLIGQEFGKDYPIAMKGTKCLVLPYLHEMAARDKNIKVFVFQLIRTREQQVRSIQKMWKANADVIRSRGWGLHPRFITKVCADWDVFAEKVYAKYDKFNYLHVPFDELMHNPKDCSKGIFKFLKHRKPKISAITEWIDPKLITE